MTEPERTLNSDDASRPSGAGLLQRKLPYIVVLVLAVSGVAYSTISNRPLAGYWEFLALATGVLCVMTQWSKVEGKEARFQLMWTQALHWGAILITMNIVLFSDVRQLLPGPATSLVLLTLLALGTFLAGINLLSLPIAFLGL